jgi:protein-tyrosine phosphatase
LIDLHSHLLPGVDDGSRDIGCSLEMARMAVDQGIKVAACTPHIHPGVYNNTGSDIMRRVDDLRHELDIAGIPLRLVAGADNHIAPDLVSRLRSGAALTLNGGRYVLIEPPHHILPPRIEETFFDLLAAGFVPILTHPERMSWISQRYDLIGRLAHAGVWMQLTAGSLLGDFGTRTRSWSCRMLDDGLIDIVATDAHDVLRRPPRMRAAFEALCSRLGEAEALKLVQERPLAVIENRSPGNLRRALPEVPAPRQGLWRRVAEMCGGR